VFLELELGVAMVIDRRAAV